MASVRINVAKDLQSMLVFCNRVKMFDDYARLYMARTPGVNLCESFYCGKENT